MNLQRVKAVLWKDLLDLRKNRALLGSMTIFPLVIVFVPVMIVYSYTHQTDVGSLKTIALYYHAELGPRDTGAAFLIQKILTDWFGMYLLMPVFVPVLISSQSVVGEKEKRTLEPLLASPISGLELLVGKSLASLIPSLVICWASFALFCVSVDWVAWSTFRELLLPNRMWLFGVGLIAPLFAVFGNGVSVLVSARVSESRLAQQISGLVTLPIIGMVGSQLAGWLKGGVAFYAIEGAVVLLLDLILAWLSIRLFDRERLMGQ